MKTFEVSITLASSPVPMTLVVRAKKEEYIEREIKLALGGAEFVVNGHTQVIISEFTPKRSDAEVASIARRYGWYIENAIRTRIERDKENVAEAQKTLDAASEEDRETAPYRSLAGMIDYFGPVIRDFTNAYEQLKKAGIFPSGW